MNLKNKIKQLAKNFNKEVIVFRRHLHQYPELSFEEFNTSEFIVSKLDELNIPYKSGFVKTGIVAIIEGKKDHLKKGVIALRADIDALPVEEENNIEYKSLHKGKMHACGHDVHTACLLGAAKILKELQNEFSGSVKLIFQPAEEKLPGGAKQMIKQGALKKPEPEIIIAQHVLPDLDVGKVGFKSGMYMASTDEIYITVKGKGGHAAIRNQIIDPVLIASHIIVALQEIVSTSPTILSFGKIVADGATNVIPDEVKIEGTFRTMDQQWREQAKKKMLALVQSVVRDMGGECELNIVKGYPPLLNDETVTQKAKQFAEEFVGKENVVDLDLTMTGEDFAYFSRECPSTFYRLGVRNNAKNITSALHSSTFNIDEEALKAGMGLMAWLAVSFLGPS